MFHKHFTLIVAAALSLLEAQAFLRAEARLKPRSKTAALAAETRQARTTAPTGNYLFAYFENNGEDGLHLAWSRDGLKWEPLNEDKSYLTPAVGSQKLMRDPCVIQGPDGVFHMVWTTGWRGRDIGIAHSKDLIRWSEQKAIPVMAEEPMAINCWAPEILYDYDMYRDHRYGAVRSRDLKNWEVITDRLEFPKGARHGTAFTVSDEVLARLRPSRR